MAQRWTGIMLLWGIGVLAAAQLGKVAALVLPAAGPRPLTRAGRMAGFAHRGRRGWPRPRSRLRYCAARKPPSSDDRPRAPRRGLTQRRAGARRRGAVCGALGREPRLSFHCHCRTEPRRCAREPGTAGRGTGAAERLRPAGLAIGAALTGAATALFSWQGVMLGWAAAAMIALSASYLLRRDVGRHASGYIMPSGSVWLLAAGFGCYTAVEVGFLALLPAYLTEQKACSPNSVLRARSPGRLSSATSQAAGAGPRSHKRPSSPRSSHLG